MAPPRAPTERAAITNSRSLSDSTWPRTMRAVVSQPTAPSATKMSQSCLPSTVTRMITKNM